MFREGRWLPVTSARLSNIISRWCTFIIKGIGGLLEGESSSYHGKTLSRQGGLGSVAREVACCFANVPHGSRPDFDSQVDLLGFDNGVMDLAAHAFRPGRRADFITRSTGYAYQPSSPAAKAAVETAFEQIYPVEEERDIVQRFCGYALSGRTDQKYFMALTDRRRGDNGKSTVLGLIMAALGDYALHARKGRSGNGSEEWVTGWVRVRSLQPLHPLASTSIHFHPLPLRCVQASSTRTPAPRA